MTLSDFYVRNRVELHPATDVLSGDAVEKVRRAPAQDAFS
jgi:hypothetical protein